MGEAASETSPARDIPRILERQFVSSYLRSNRRFPQTRFYFVIDLSRVVGASSMLSLLETGIELPDSTIAALAKAASTIHAQTHVPTPVTPERIRTDVEKMFQALLLTFTRYQHIAGGELVGEQFTQECTELVSAIDGCVLSERYLDFVSPKRISSAGVQLKRSSALVLNSYFDALKQHDNLLLRALMPEISRPIWVVRSIS